MMRNLFASTLVFACTLCLSASAQDRSGVRPAVMSVPSGPGSIEGLGEAFEPQLQAGSSTYGIDIDVPPGVAGFEPEVTLQYSSGTGYDVLGLGWSLSMPAVERSTDRRLPTYTVEDRWVLSGMGGKGSEELVQMSDGSYRFEIEGAFARGRRSGDGFIFTNTSGVIFEFDGSASSVVRDGSKDFSYALTAQEDTFGHRIEYIYDKPAGERRYLTSIRYNLHAEGSVNEVRFSYEERPDALTSYLSAFAVRTTKRLSKIEVLHAGEPVRQYDLSYELGTGLSRLVKVELTGKDGETTLPALSLTYAEFDAAIAPKQMLNGPTRELGASVEIADVNGDALPDVVQMDASLDGGAYRLRPNLDGTQFGEWQNIDSASTWLDNPDTQLADVNGDGAPDVLARLSSSSDGLRYYPGGSTGFGAAVVLSPNLSPAPSDPNVKFVDLNHDRRVDWLHIEASSGDVRVAINQGDGTFSAVQNLGQLASGQVLTFDGDGLRLADMNGDGLQDIAQLRSGSLRYFPAKGSGHFGSVVSISGAPTLSSSELERSNLSDIDGNGLADLVVVNAAHVLLYLNLASSALSDVVRIENTPGSSSSIQVRLFDINANGSTDVVWLDRSLGVDEAWTYVDVLEQGKPGLLTAIDNCLGQVIRMGYAGIGEMRAWANEHSLDWSKRSPLGQMLLSQMWIDDSLGSVQHSRFYYADGYFDPYEREFRGFAYAQRIDVGDASQPTLHTISTFDVGETEKAFKGLPLSTIRQNAEGGTFDRTQNSYELRLFDSADAERPLRFAYLKQSDSEVFELGDTPIKTRKTFEYDDFGNVTKQAEWGIIEGENLLAGGDERITTRSYAQNTERWILGALASEKISDASGTRITETRTYYDGSAFEGLPLGQIERGAVSRKTSWRSGDEFVDAERNEHDAHGNILAQIDGRDGRSDYAYDESGTFVTEEMLTVDESHALTFRATYDPAFGTMLSFLDPNEQTTTFEHDALGRLMTIIEPGDGKERPTKSYEYTLGTPTSVIRERLIKDSDSDDVETSITHVDGLGRKRAIFEDAGDGSWAASEIKSYGPRGLVSFAQRPLFASNADYREADRDQSGIELSYDALGRPLSEVEPDGAMRAFSYAPLRSSRFDENNRRRTDIVDGLGRLIQHAQQGDEDDAVTTYSYNAADKLTELSDARGSVRRYTYNGLLQRTKVQDPNAGTWEFSYDVPGGLLSRTDPEGNQLRYVYDARGRALEEWHRAKDGEERLSVRYHYDERSERFSWMRHTQGQLSWVEDEVGEVHFGYDARGRATDEVRRWSDGTEHANWSEYDSQDRLKRRGYPNKTYFETSYDARGLTQSITGLISNVSWSAWGSLQEASYGNGVKSQREYDSRQRLRHMFSGAGSATLLDLRFELDPSSRVIEETDARELSAALNLSASYSYDARYRLASEQNRLGTTTFSYDVMSNLLSVTSDRADLPAQVDYEYTDSNGPDRVTKFADESLKYDAAGRLLEDGARVLEWDAKGRIAKVVREDENGAQITESYQYGYDDRRVIKRTISSDGETEVRYPSPDVEVREGKIIRYVELDNKRAIRLDAVSDSHSAQASAAAVSTFVQFPKPSSPWLLLFGLLALLASVIFSFLKRRSVALGALSLASVLLSCGGDDYDPHAGVLISEWPADAELYLHDLHGSPVVRAGSEGEVLARYAYNAYGSVRGLEESSADPFRFAGNEFDKGAALADFKARPYRPELSSFIKAYPVAVFDPESIMQEPERLSPYSYALGEPIGMTDPDGMHPGPTPGGYRPPTLFDKFKDFAGDFYTDTVEGIINSPPGPGMVFGGLKGVGKASASGIGKVASRYAPKATKFIGKQASRLSKWAGQKLSSATKAVGNRILGGSGSRAAKKLHRVGSEKRYPRGMRSVNTSSKVVNFSELGIKSPEAFAKHINKVVAGAKGANVRQLAGGRTAYWDDLTGTVVIQNPKAVDMGTAFRPTLGKQYFTDILK
ncbi:MAG: VCBS repeat-containing protein [Myxococcales bacterium]|nr:MAG: VCBS repeat-containing protein [Myxococcales bacterium]